MTSLPLLFATLLLIPGLALAFIPVIPAILYFFAVATGYGIYTSFERLSVTEFAILGVITVVSLAIDQLAGLIGAKWGGASRRAMLFGFLGAIGGAILGGPLMSFAGLFGGIFIAEVLQLKSHLEAFKAARGGLIGALIGYISNIFLAFTFFILFIVFTYQ